MIEHGHWNPCLQQSSFIASSHHLIPLRLNLMVTWWFRLVLTIKLLSTICYLIRSRSNCTYYFRAIHRPTPRWRVSSPELRFTECRKRQFRGLLRVVLLPGESDLGLWFSHCIGFRITRIARIIMMCYGFGITLKIFLWDSYMILILSFKALRDCPITSYISPEVMPRFCPDLRTWSKSHMWTIPSALYWKILKRRTSLAKKHHQLSPTTTKHYQSSHQPSPGTTNLR